MARLSLNGQDDVLYEVTEFDAEYVPIFGPQLGPTPPFDNSDLIALRQRAPISSSANEIIETDATGNSTEPTPPEPVPAPVQVQAEAPTAPPEQASQQNTTSQSRNENGSRTHGGDLYNPAEPTEDATDSAHTNTTRTGDSDNNGVNSLPPLLRALVVDAPVVS
jgi:hypothetical protein